jgi:hypothetical protein
VVDLTFDAFDREGGGALVGWMLLTGNEHALDPIIEATHKLVDELHPQETADGRRGRCTRRRSRSCSWRSATR